MASSTLRSDPEPAQLAPVARTATCGPAAAPVTGPSGVPVARHEAPAIDVVALRRVFTLPGRRCAAVTAVDDIALRLQAGSFTALVGASGCGKSTLLQCIAGLDRPTSGTVRLLGTDTTALRPRDAARFRADHVGFIFQDDNLVSALSARDNVALPGRLRRRPLPRTAVDAALERLGLTGQARHLPHELSGGERQRVAIARVLASRPALVFADEPTAALDIAAGAGVLDWLGELSGLGTTVLMVTHDASAAARADEVLVMGAGRLMAEMPGGNADAIARAVLHARGAGEMR